MLGNKNLRKYNLPNFILSWILYCFKNNLLYGNTIASALHHRSTWYACTQNYNIHHIIIIWSWSNCAHSSLHYSIRNFLLHFVQYASNYNPWKLLHQTRPQLVGSNSIFCPGDRCCIRTYLKKDSTFLFLLNLVVCRIQLRNCVDSVPWNLRSLWRIYFIS